MSGLPSLFDASALLNLVTERGHRALELAKGQFVLDLTPYEMGNALWRNSVLEKRLDGEAVDATLNVLRLLFGEMRTIGSGDIDLVSVMRIAREERMTFYDASYVAAARDRSLALITDDAKLSGKASRYIPVKSSSQL